MKKSRNNILRVFLVISIFAAFTTVNSAQNDLLKISDVEKNIKIYLNLVFDGQPTLKDYYYYHGKHNVSEKTMENELTKNLLGSATSGLASKIYGYRNANSNKVPSIYFSRLKKYYPIEIDSINIKNVEIQKRNNGRFFYTIIVTGYSYPVKKDIEYKFYHNAYSTGPTEEGIIDILEINGNPINEILLFN
jgi:hypothetical protein